MVLAFAKIKRFFVLFCWQGGKELEKNHLVSELIRRERVAEDVA
jgi:hypothetical protein